MMKKLLSLLLALILTASCLSGVVFAAEAEVSYTVSGVTKEGTLKEAVSAVSPAGGTIKLLKDLTGTVTVASAITLDLNGFTLSAPSGSCVKVGSAAAGVVGTAGTGVTHIKNGSIVAKNHCLLIYQGGLHIDGLTAYSQSSQNTSFYDITGLYNGENLVENSTIVSAAWGAISFNNNISQEKTLLTVKNSTFANVKTGSSSYAFSMQSGATRPNLHLAENVRLMAYSSGYSLMEPNIHVTGLTTIRRGGTVDLQLLDKYFPNMTLSYTPDFQLPTVDIADTLENRQKAMVETAWAYYYKNPYVQYDNLTYPAGFNNSTGAMVSANRSLGNRNGESQSNTPEMASPARYIHHVCSFYVYQCTSLAVNYRAMGGWKNYLIKPLAEGTAETDKTVQVFQYSNYDFDENGVATTVRPAAEIEENMLKAKSLLQPGDIVNYYRTERETGRTHAVMWIGDYDADGYGDLLNVDGKGFKAEYMNDASGVVDKMEATGGVELNTDNFNCPNGEYFLFNQNSSQCLGKPAQIESYSIHRFANAGELTESSKTRLQYPGLEIYYTADKSIYGAVTKGDTVTYTLSVTNNSKQNHNGILVQIPAPVNAAITAIDGVAGTADKVQWSLNVAAGETVKKTYAVKATGKVGDIITAAGFVHTIALGEIYTAIQSSAPTAAAVTAAMNAHKSKNGAEFATAVCKALGSDLTVPDADGFRTALFTPRTITSATVTYDLVQPDPIARKSSSALSSACIYNFFGGYGTATAADCQRVNKLLVRDLQAGDILLWQKNAGDATQVAVHNGENLMELQEGVFTAMTDQNELDKFLRYRFFIALRPTQMAEDNSACALSFLTEDGTQPLSSVPDTDFTLRVAIRNAPAATGLLTVAAYNGSGKMVSAASTPVTLTQGQYTALPLPVKSDGTLTSIKAFLYTQAGIAPLALTAELRNSSNSLGGSWEIITDGSFVNPFG